jgi:hypothetical protein
MKKVIQRNGQNAKRAITVELHVDLLPPGITEDIGRHRLDLVRDPE